MTKNQFNPQVEGGVATPKEKKRVTRGIKMTRSQHAKQKKTQSSSEDFEDVIKYLNGDSDTDCVILSSKKSKMIHILD